MLAFPHARSRLRDALAHHQPGLEIGVRAELGIAVEVLRVRRWPNQAGQCTNSGRAGEGTVCLHVSATQRMCFPMLRRSSVSKPSDS